MSNLRGTARRWMDLAAPECAEGQSMVEYAIIFVLIILACVAILTTLGDVVVNGLWGLIASMPF